MKYIVFDRLKPAQKKEKNKGISSKAGKHLRKEKSGVVIPLHALLKNELKLYRGASKSARLGVLRKYDELIAMARKK
jgi:hypothetical protein